MMQQQQQSNSACCTAIAHAQISQQDLALLQQQRCPPSAGWLDSIADRLSALRSNKQDRVAWSRNGVPRPSYAKLHIFYL